MHAYLIYIIYNNESVACNFAKLLLCHNCREGKFPTFHKLTHHTIKFTKYRQLQSATYCC